jgi:hypothetical protein
VSALRRHADERGQSALELVGMVPLMALVALAVAQALLIGHTAIVTEQAARTGARVAMVTDDGGASRAAAVGSLPSWLRDGAQVRFSGGGSHRLELSSRIPTIVPGLPSGMRVNRTVEMPDVGSSWD